MVAPYCAASATGGRSTGSGVTVTPGRTRIRTIGSKIADAWVLEAVDEQARTITIRHRSGHLVTVELESP